LLLFAIISHIFLLSDEKTIAFLIPPKMKPKKI